MNNIVYLPKYTDITHAQLWDALKVPRNRPGSEHLHKAIQSGKSGKHTAAYTALGQYHREALADEWAHFQTRYNAGSEPDQSIVNEVLQNKIRCYFGSEMIQFDKAIDWFPEETLLDASLTCFHYFGWIQAITAKFVRTADPAIGRFLADLLEQYYFNIRKDPRWSGPNDQRYKWFTFNQLGIACRTPYLLAVYLGLLNQDLASPRLIEAISKQMLGFGRALGPQNRKYLGHNIQTHGCRIHFQIARQFPEFREARAWDRAASRRLLEQITRGYNADGFQAERVWGYASHTLASIVETYETAKRLGGLGGDEDTYLQGIRNAYQFYAKTAGPRPAMLMPAYGDGSPHSSVKPILKKGQAFFPESKDDNLGVDRTSSYCFKEAGFTIFRNGDDNRSTYMDLSFGQFAGWHSHYDLLSMNMIAYGEQVLAELCRFGPYSIPLDPTFRAPEAHNQLLIDGMVYDSRRVKGEDVTWHSEEHVDYFSATHRAYHFYCFGKTKVMTSPNIEALVRRTVLFVKDPGYAVVLDSVTDISKPDYFGRSISQRWHGPKPFKAINPTTVKTIGRGPGIVMSWTHPETFQPLEFGTDFTREQVAKYVKGGYDRHRVVARRWQPLDRTHGISGFATLLFPYASKAPEVSITAVDGPSKYQWRAETYEVQLPGRTDLITLNPERVDDLKILGKQNQAVARVKIGNQKRAIVIQ